MDYTNYKNWLKENLDEERYEHSVGVAECAMELAKRFDLDEEKAYLCGLIHDCAKCFSTILCMFASIVKVKSYPFSAAI